MIAKVLLTMGIVMIMKNASSKFNKWRCDDDNNGNDDNYDDDNDNDDYNYDMKKNASSSHRE